MIGHRDLLKRKGDKRASASCTGQEDMTFHLQNIKLNL